MTQTKQPAHVTALKRLNPCSHGLEFARQYRTIQAAWRDCRRASWMEWLLSRVNETIVLPHESGNYCPGCDPQWIREHYTISLPELKRARR